MAENMSVFNDPSEVFQSISDAIHGQSASYHSGYFTSSIYDTAWVSMLARRTDNLNTWLFPQSFEYILRSQLDDGTWASYASPVDGILNTLASLLTLLVHSREAKSDDDQLQELRSRITRASEGLKTMLQVWRVQEAVHVGFEVLVPGLLRQVAEFGIEFEFPEQTQMLKLYRERLSAFTPEIVYGLQPTTLLHSLEALVGLVNFDRVQHHCSEQLGLFGSPAATAAYLMKCSTWDDRAEKYLHKVVARNDGSVPSAFPTPLFEFSWALSSLLFHGIVKKVQLRDEVIVSLSSWYRQLLKNQSGIVGFAPEILADADDTARVLLTLHHLGSDIDCTPMIKEFRSLTYFLTYRFESKPSFSANCNVCLTLLADQSAGTTDHTAIIQNTVKFLLSLWSLGQMSDKWNLSPYYSFMLLTDVLVSVLKKYSLGYLPHFSEALLYHQIPLALCQVLSRTMTKQAQDGSWNSSPEETAFSMIMIAECLALPWDEHLKAQLQCIHRKAYGYVKDSLGRSSTAEYVWIEKVTYGSSLLHYVYLATALRIDIQTQDWPTKVCDSFTVLPVYATKILPMFSRLPLFKKHTFNCTELALVEATRFADRLKQRRNAIFPQDEVPMTEDRYLLLIPLIWTICNQSRRHSLTSSTLWGMILLSTLNYQIDEYMETVVKAFSPDDVEKLLLRAKKTCTNSGIENTSDETESRDVTHETSKPKDCQPDQSHELTAQDKAANVIDAYIKRVLHRPLVVATSMQDRRELAYSLYDFLVSKAVQNFNSNLSSHADILAVSRDIGKLHHASTFFQWVRSTASESTSCPFSFRFFTALLYGQVGNLDRGDPRVRYLMCALATHLATIRRLYNDCGSASRDKLEGNFNSLDFEDFNSAAIGTEKEVLRSINKERLLNLAAFERGCMDSAYKNLYELVQQPAALEGIGVFDDVTDLFGQIYVYEDIASRKKDPTSKGA